MNNKISQYENMDNYYFKFSQYDSDSMVITESYKKQEKSLARRTNLSAQEEKKIVVNYKENGKLHVYKEKNGNKLAILDYNQKYIGQQIEVVPFESWFERIGIHNMKELMHVALISSIASEICNQKDCYKITIQDSYEVILYIEKATGLPVRCLSQEWENGQYKGDFITEYQYYFDCVTDEEIQEPNITEYEILGN